MNNVEKIKSNKIDLHNVEVKKITVEEFISLPSVPMQRDTEGRAKTNKVKGMLKILKPTHLEVALCVLEKDDDYYGTLYPKGWKGIVNGNTRKWFWENQMSDKIPANLNATIYYCNSMEEVRDIYNQYDNPDSMERNQQKVFGLLGKLFKFSPTSLKIQKGEILTGLNYACYKLNPKRWNQPGIKAEDLTYQLAEYIDEIKILDTLIKHRSNWDQAFIAAALMSIKKYGKDERLFDFWRRVDDRLSNRNVSGNSWDGVTHVCNEWFEAGKNAYWQHKGTNWKKEGGFDSTVPFVLYWIEKYMNNVCISKLGSNWKDTANTWFHDMNATNNNLNKFFSIKNN